MLFICSAAAAIIAIVLMVVGRDSDYRKKDFVYNGKNEPYAQEIPLHEMNFHSYKKYMNTTSTLAVPLYVKQIDLPCDVYYYFRKEDTEPALTLEKGTKIDVIADGLGGIGYPYGYGLQCWPDYEKGWRYGQPFVVNDSTQSSAESTYYYVKTAELEAVAKEFYRNNKKQCSEFSSSSKFAKWITRQVDRLLYEGGAFCSNDL